MRFSDASFRRYLPVVLIFLIAAIQYPLWLGKGGWLKVWDINRRLDAQEQTNIALRARNTALDAEVRDLKTGYAAIEERARVELGMVKQDETFYQIIDNAPPAPPAASKPAAPAR